MITTKQPTDDMIEVAIVSMEQALEADGEAIPAGSAAFEREPLADVEVRLKARSAIEGLAQAAVEPATAETETPAPSA